MKKKYNIKVPFRALMTFMMILSITVLGSCEDDFKQVKNPYVNFGDEISEIFFDAGGGEQKVDMYTNLHDWKVNILYHTEDESWIDVFDTQGSGSGKLKIAVVENLKEPFLREAEIQITDKTNTVYGSLKVSQNKVDPYLELNMRGLDKLTLLGAGGKTFVALKTNVVWRAKIVEGESSWIEMTEQTADTLRLNIIPKDTEGERNAKIRFTQVGSGNEGIFTEINIRQLGSETSIDHATSKTVAEALAYIETLPSGGGLIEENFYIDAWVTSDKSKKALPDDVLFVQDDSGRGLKLEVSSAAENIFKLGDKLRIHLVACTATKEVDSESLSVGISGSLNVVSQEASAGIEPVMLDDFSQIENYENTLVTVSPIEFAVPMGMYVNSQEANYENYDAESERALPLGDTPRESGIIMRDKNGGTLKLYSNYKFTDKFAQRIPEGSGPITGIVMKRATATLAKEVTLEPAFIMRLRSNADNGVSNNASQRLTKTIVRFGPFVSLKADSVRATGSNGYINMMRNSVNAITTNNTDSNSDRIYWGWTYCRMHPTTLGEDGRATDPMTTNVNMQYVSLNTQKWWTKGKLGLSDEAKKDLLIKDWEGEAWIIRTSLKDVSSPAYLTFTTSSSNTGPRFFVAEWSQNLDAPLADWKEIDRYNAVAWNSNRQMLPNDIILPDEMLGKSPVYIRLRVIEDLRAYNDIENEPIGNTGTNRIGFLEISQLK